MSTFGLCALLIAFASTGVGTVCLCFAEYMHRRKSFEASETLMLAGHAAHIAAFVALSLCCGILVFCFMTDNYTIDYVLRYHSNSSDALSWLYRLSGLWAGRQGSLLFWAWLISLFNAVISLRNINALKRLDSSALMVSGLVLAAFTGVLLFSQDNMPFTLADESYFNADGSLSAAASLYGLNTLLEHWAMCIHPPTLFIGYAGLTVPFAYAIAALIVNDPSTQWVAHARRYALVSWLFLGIGIGLGAIWAYVVLGWGGYWGWDPVENASLLSWLMGVALIHSFTVYRQRGAFKRWCVMCACLCFSFVIVGTFISRSGIVESVHAFEGDTVSLVLFGCLIVMPLLTGIAGLIVRRKSFGPNSDGHDEVQNMFSKDAAYYFNNVIMLVFTLLLTYMTVSSALPEFLPFGGQSLGTGSYNAVARPLGIVYLAILCACPLLSWGRTDKGRFLKLLKLPAFFAALLFALLLVYFLTYLLPSYDAVVETGGTFAEELLLQGPAWYYNGLALAGLLVASLLFFSAAVSFMRGIKAFSQAERLSKAKVFTSYISTRASTLGGFIAHCAMAVILVGLIGSSMYVTERSAYVSYDEQTDTAESFVIKDYELVYTHNSVELQENDDDILYTVYFDVYKNGAYLGEVNPAVQLVQSTQQQKLIASVISLPLEDLFVVYYGVNADTDLSIDVLVNPLISFVWIGAVLLYVGIGIAAVGRRKVSCSTPSK